MACRGRGSQSFEWSQQAAAGSGGSVPARSSGARPSGASQLNSRPCPLMLARLPALLARCAAPRSRPFARKMTVLSGSAENVARGEPAAKVARTEAPAEEALRVRRMNEHALLPKRGSAGAAGYDLARWVGQGRGQTLGPPDRWPTACAEPGRPTAAAWRRLSRPCAPPL